MSRSHLAKYFNRNRIVSEQSVFIIMFKPRYGSKGVGALSLTTLHLSTMNSYVKYSLGSSNPRLFALFTLKGKLDNHSLHQVNPSLNHTHYRSEHAESVVIQ